MSPADGARALSILYRGPLASCNYDCPYCPFAKQIDPPDVLAADQASLSRFVRWCEEQKDFRPLSVFFTPWGESLVRSWYREAMLALSRLSWVRRVAVQTNLSVGAGWLDGGGVPEKIGFWATFHPGEVGILDFVHRVEQVCARGAPISVGVVGMREHLEVAEDLRRLLPPQVYLWINAPKTRIKQEPGYYDAQTLSRFLALDPLLPHNLVEHESLGKACHTGNSVISVDGEGNARRCHFVPTFLGNLYQADFPQQLFPRPCEQPRCGCHIGYVHMPERGLYEQFGEGVLERAIPPARSSA